jgi:hypothetical protein
MSAEEYVSKRGKGWKRASLYIVRSIHPGKIFFISRQQTQPSSDSCIRERFCCLWLGYSGDQPKVDSSRSWFASARAYCDDCGLKNAQTSTTTGKTKRPSARSTHRKLEWRLLGSRKRARLAQLRREDATSRRRLVRDARIGAQTARTHRQNQVASLYCSSQNRPIVSCLRTPQICQHSGQLDN